MCENVLLLTIFKIVNAIITVAKISLPLIIIVMGAVDLVKFAVSGNQDDFTKSAKSFMYRFMAAVIIFFLPTIVNFAMNRVSSYDKYNIGCLFEANDTTIAIAKSKNAEKAVEYAEKNPSYQNINIAKRYVNKVVKKQEKEALNSRLDVVKKQLDDKLAEQRKIIEEETAPIVTPSGGTGQSGMAGASNQEKIKRVFPDGVPTTAEGVEKYLINVTVPITTKDGTKSTTKVQVNKFIADDVVAALTAAQKEGFRVYEIGGYRKYGSDSAGAVRDVGLIYSQHCYGLAVDINVNENCYKKPPTAACSVGSLYSPGSNQYSITTTGALYKSFISNGWGWGGNWNSLKDYMHFSFFGN